MLFYKGSGCKKNSTFFFFWSEGVGGEGKARVSEYLTMDPNKKCFWRGRGGGKWREVGG